MGGGSGHVGGLGTISEHLVSALHAEARAGEELVAAERAVHVEGESAERIQLHDASPKATLMGTRKFGAANARSSTFDRTIQTGTLLTVRAA